MGGRGANEQRNKITGIIPSKYHTYHSTGKLVSTVNGKVLKVSILEENKPSARHNLPEFSNTKNLTFYGVVNNKGELIRIRMYENGKTVCEFGFHITDGSNVPVIHKHEMSFPTTKDLAKWTEKQKKMGAHRGEHEPITDDDRKKYGPLLDFLGKRVEDLPEYIKMS